MSFSVTISGHVDDPDQAEGVEQDLTDKLVALLKEFDEHITYAEGNFAYQGGVDLKAAGNVDQAPPDEPPVEPPVDEPPVDVPPDEPPVDEPPVDEPPIEQPPVEQPPVDEPPVDDVPPDTPPVEQPPVEATLPLYMVDGDVNTDETLWAPAPFTTGDAVPRPLFTYAEDTAGEPATGDGLGGVWHLYVGEPLAV